MKKRYLKNIEDIEALRDTDTKIRFEYDNHGVAWKEEHYQFVNGVLCCFWDGKLTSYNAMLSLRHGNYYIEVDEHDCVRQDAEDEPSEDWIGKLGVFWDDDGDKPLIDILWRYTEDDEYRFEGESCSVYEHFRPLTPEEVEKYTGYKVVTETLNDRRDFRNEN